MLSTTLSTRGASFPAGAAFSAGGDTAALLDRIGPADDLRVLLIGPHMLEAMCALLRGGCTEVTTLHVGDRTEPGSADVIVAAEVNSLETADRVLAQARRAAVPLSRLLIQLAPDSSALLRAQIGRTLIRHGFGPVRSRGRCDALIEAELPLLGRLAACG